jgi:hypothetical protein
MSNAFKSGVEVVPDNSKTKKETEIDYETSSEDEDGSSGNSFLHTDLL